MRFEELLASFPANSWCDQPELVAKHKGSVTISKPESRRLLGEVVAAIEGRDAVDASNRLLAGFLLDEERFLAQVKKEGVLRISRCSYASAVLTGVVASLQSAIAVFSESVAGYLRSVENLYEISKSVRSEYEWHRDWLSSQREVGVVSCLASLDLLFMRQADGFGLGAKHKSSRDSTFFTIEELAEGFSSLLALYGNEFGELCCNAPIDPEGCKEGFYMRALISAAHLASFREWELRVDRMGYSIVKNVDKCCFRISAPTHELERAIELGFIHSFMHRGVHSQDSEQLREDSHSLKDLGEKTAASLSKNSLIELVEEPLRRYVVQIPEPLLAKLAEIGELLFEEKVALSAASNSLLTPVDKLPELRVNEDLTLRDLFLLSRLFQFIRAVSTPMLLNELQAQPEVVMASLVPAFQRDKLVKLMATVVGEQKATAAIELLVTDVTGHVDIQYRPIIPAGESMLVPVNIYANSAMYRNPFVLTGERPYEDGTVDPLSSSVAGFLRAAGYMVKEGQSYRHGGVAGEVDVLALKDGLLLALECKNSILPTGVHELLTSYDYVRKAGQQLTRFSECFADDAFRRQIATKTGLDFSDDIHLVTGIVMSNRMFMGLRVDGHPVRGSQEMQHFAEQGTVSLGDEERSFWLGDTLASEDMRRYFEGDVTYHPQWNAMSAYISTFEFDACTVEFESVSLDLIALADELGFENVKAELIKQASEGTDEHHGPAFVIRPE